MKTHDFTKIEQEVLLSKSQYEQGNFTSYKTVDEFFEKLSLK